MNEVHKVSTLYVEPFSGISGNMFIGALLDLGASFSYLEQEISKLSLGEYKLIYEHVDKCGIHASHFDVELPGHKHHHEGEQHDHGREHSTHEQEMESELLQECHDHVHHHEHRNLQDILTIIDNSALSDNIKNQAAKVFRELAKAEAKVHGKTMQEIHFHEVGAVDTIIDVVGSLLLLENLHISKIYVGTIQTGYGFVQCAHGLMPIPAPATAELLKELPNYKGIIDKELTTPTGAVLMHALATAAPNKPAGFHTDKIGYGAGTWDLPIPNVVRLYWERKDVAPDRETDLVVGECNLDDSTGELLANALKLVLEAGALDAWLTPIIMKKGRPGEKFSFICTPAALAKIEPIVFANTSTLGIRYTGVFRTSLERNSIIVKIGNSAIRVKCGYYQGKLVNIAPEYEDCLVACQAENISLKEVMHLAATAARKEIHG